MAIEPSVTQLLDQARDGDSEAWNLAFEMVYAELRSIARRVLGRQASQTLTPTALVHECYLRLCGEAGRKVENRAHFHALAARAMRCVLMNRARDRCAAKRGGGLVRTNHSRNLDTQAFALAGELEREALELLALDHALVQLESEDPRLVRVLECRLFAGLTEEETAAAIELPLRSMQRRFAEARRRITALLASG